MPINPITVAPNGYTSKLRNSVRRVTPSYLQTFLNDKSSQEHQLMSILNNSRIFENSIGRNVMNDGYIKWLPRLYVLKGLLLLTIYPFIIPLNTHRTG